MCALSCHTATYILQCGSSSKSWRKFENFATSAKAGDLQRRRHVAVMAYRSQKAHPHKAGASGQDGPIDGYLPSQCTRVMLLVPARPHSLRFVLLQMISLWPFAVAGNKFLMEFVRGLGGPYDPPSGPTVRDVLLNLCVHLLGLLLEEIIRLRRSFRGVPFFHIVINLWTERHGTGSYESMALRSVDIEDFFNGRVPPQRGAGFGAARTHQH